MFQRALTEEQTALRTHFVSFFEDDSFRDKYDGRLQDMMRDGKNRLIVDIGDMLDFAVGDQVGLLGRNMLRDPGTYLPICEIALHDLVLRKQPEYLKVDYRSKPVHVGIEGPVDQILSPRELYSRHLNRLVALEGIVTRQSALRPRLLETVHFCPSTNKFSRKEYRDQLSPMIDSAHLPTVNVMPLTDIDGNLMRTELGLSSFVDSQCAILQETPESAPAGQLPRSVELRLDDDLVDSVKPGDRIVVVGMYRPYTSNEKNAGAGMSKGGEGGGFQTILLANHVYLPQQSVKVPRLFPALEDELRRFALRHQARHTDGVLRVLSQSVAPTIYGLNMEKKAILLLMAGGVERLAHHSHIRGDINILLVGEPSTAKSQLLRFVLGVVPHALSTTGKGSSGVGLTAAVTVDQYSNERSLSAGAMVLADRGILCVDEFDKMTPGDRVAMHEAMEQQTVTIAKAGISASLNARCSVLAAANPTYGSYSVKHSLDWNVGLPETLLSRFDLTFIILDRHSATHNRRTGSHILQNHMRASAVPFHSQNVQTVVGCNDNEQQQQQNQNQNQDFGGGGNNNATLQREQENAAQVASARSVTAQPSDQPVPVQFLRRYLQLARHMSPLLTENSQRLVSENFATIRSEQVARGGFAVTYRTLDSMIRLATAHAKLRLSTEVSEEDVVVATQLIRSSALVSQVSSSREDAEEAQDQNTGDAQRAGAGEGEGDEQQQQQQRLREQEAQMFGPPLSHDVSSSATAAAASGGQTRMRPTEFDEADEEERFPRRVRRTDESSGQEQGQEQEQQQQQQQQQQRRQQQLAAAAAVDIQAIRPILNDVLQRLRREQRGEIAMHELRDRVQQKMGQPVPLPSLLNAVNELNPEEYVYNSSDAEDVVYFI